MLDSSLRFQGRNGFVAAVRWQIRNNNVGDDAGDTGGGDPGQRDRGIDAAGAATGEDRQEGRGESY